MIGRIALSVFSMKRPSVDELLNLPQISIRLKERKINQHYTLIKKKEEELAAKEVELTERERRVAQKEQELILRERALQDKENDKELYHCLYLLG